MALPCGCVLAGIRDLPPFAAVPFHHAILFDPGGPDGCACPVLPRRYQPSPKSHRLGILTPTVRTGFLLTQVRVGVVFEAGSVRLRYGLVDCSPPGRTDLGSLPAAETFTPELSPNESPPPGVRYDCGADWAICAGGTRTHWNVGLLGRTRFHYRAPLAAYPGRIFTGLSPRPSWAVRERTSQVLGTGPNAGNGTLFGGIASVWHLQMLALPQMARSQPFG